MAKIYLLLFGLLFSNLIVNAQSAEVVKQIDAGNFTDLSAIGNRMFFTKTDGGISSSWVSDGSTGGTVEFLPYANIQAASGYTGFGGKVYCSVYDSVYGSEPGVTDGTGAGTSRLLDIKPGKKSSYPIFFKATVGKQLFMANDSVHGYELWATDGTTAGTEMIKEFATGTANGLESTTAIVATEYNGKIYFSANELSVGFSTELWYTDGTTAGTQKLLDINSTGSASPSNFKVYNGKLYFTANDGIHGEELWVTDGTAANTHMVKDVSPSTDVIINSNFDILNNKLVFTVASESPPTSLTNYSLWQTDGTDVGTVKLIDTLGSRSKVFNSNAYYSKLNTNNEYELWKTDGTLAGTQFITNVDTGNGKNPIRNFIPAGNKLYFTTVSNDQNVILRWGNLWVTDGTLAGTSLAVPYAALNLDEGPVYLSGDFAPFNGSLYFAGVLDPLNMGQAYQFCKTPAGPTTGIWPVNTITITTYPNPAMDYVNILAQSPIDRLTLYNLQGEIMQQINPQGQTDRCNVTISAYPQGVYFAHILSANGQLVISKFIKQ